LPQSFDGFDADISTNEETMSSLQSVMSDPSVHFFCKRILTQCQELDPVDALKDLELAVETWRVETDRILAVDRFTEELHCEVLKQRPEGYQV
jgi:hypothetical protein